MTTATTAAATLEPITYPKSNDGTWFSLDYQDGRYFEEFELERREAWRRESNAKHPDVPALKPNGYDRKLKSVLYYKKSGTPVFKDTEISLAIIRDCEKKGHRTIYIYSDAQSNHGAFILDSAKDLLSVLGYDRGFIGDNGLLRFHKYEN